jgi:hypothetical protein
MSKTDYVLIAAATILLLFVNWLAFHDFGEVHTFRDWLMLSASILVLVRFARDVWKHAAARPPAKVST